MGGKALLPSTCPPYACPSRFHRDLTRLYACSNRFHRDGLTLQALLDLTDENVPAELLASIRAQGGEGGSDGGGGDEEEGEDEEGEMGGTAQRAKSAAVAKVCVPYSPKCHPCLTVPLPSAASVRPIRDDCPPPHTLSPPHSPPFPCREAGQAERHLPTG